MPSAVENSPPPTTVMLRLRSIVSLAPGRAYLKVQCHDSPVSRHVWIRPPRAVEHVRWVDRSKAVEVPLHVAFLESRSREHVGEATARPECCRRALRVRSLRVRRDEPRFFLARTDVLTVLPTFTCVAPTEVRYWHVPGKSGTKIPPPSAMVPLAVAHWPPAPEGPLSPEAYTKVTPVRLTYTSERKLCQFPMYYTTRHSNSTDLSHLIALPDHLVVRTGLGTSPRYRYNVRLHFITAVCACYQERDEVSFALWT